MSYAVSAALKTAVSLEDPGIYRKLDELLIRRNGLAIAVRGLTGCYPGTLLSVLQVVATATLRWQKPYELLRVRDFVHGRADSACYTPGMSDRTVYRALKVLCNEGILAKMTANDGRDVHYALVYETILERVGNAVDSLRGRSLIWQETARLYEELQTSPDVARLACVIRHYAGHAIRDAREFIRSLRNMGERAVATLESAVRTARQAARDHTDRRSTARASRPLVHGNRVDGRAGLELWHREVADTGAHPGYVPARTGKLAGQMQHWLRELVAQGLDDAAIRERIRDVVNKWAHVPERKRELSCVSAAGRPYKTRMPMTPNFDVFYAHRTQICPILEDVCAPDRFDSGEERGAATYL